MVGMNSSNWLKRFKQRLQRNFFIILFAAFALLLLNIPLQHFIALGRYQHYGMAFFLLGLGYFLHTIWLWSRTRFWARISYLMIGIFFCYVGQVFYANPWLDWKTAVQTEDKVQAREQIFSYFLCFVVLISIFLLLAARESRADNK